MSKILLIGANHAGTAAANTILDNYPEHELTILDSNSNISYLGCGTALWVGRQIEDPNSLFYCSKDVLAAKHAKVYMQTKAVQIDFNAKVVHAVGPNRFPVVESYDKLILATGSVPITPNIPGVDLQGVEYVKLFQDGQKIDKELDDPAIQSVAVIGAGYIGVEIAEAIHRRGKKAKLFETDNTCLSGYYDEWFSHDMDKVLESNGIELHYGEEVRSINPRTMGNTGRVGSIATNKGEYRVDMVILAIGFRPNTELGTNRLFCLPNGAYQVDLNQQTNLPDVYAVGDCASVYSNAMQSSAYIALATNAVRSGIVAAHNACGTPLQSVGVQGSNGICIFGYKMVSTGLNLEAAKKAGFQPVHTDFEDLQKPAFIQSDNHKVKLRILYDKKTRRVLGAQMASYQDISMGIHMFSLAIEEGVTIDKLKLLDIFFLPHFNQPYNYITMAALSAK